MPLTSQEPRPYHVSVEPVHAPMAMPRLAPLFGGDIESVAELVNYGYRGAWKIRVNGQDFAVKADVRDGFQAREVWAHRRAAAAGVPVPPIALFRAGPPPVFVMRWVEGEPLHGSGSPVAWCAAGAALRRVHSASPSPQGGDASRLVLGPLESELPYLVNRHGLREADAALVLSHARRLLPLIDAAPLAWLHGDCQAEHFLIDPTDGRLNAVLDWADACAGDPVADFAVLTLFDGDVLAHVLKGYEAEPGLRDRVTETLPLYRAVRGAQAARWLDGHGFPGHEWPLRCVRRVALLEASLLEGETR